MKSIITAQFTEKQAQIDRKRAAVVARYPALWANIISEWNKPGPHDLAWLVYSANYLFRTHNVRWAIDPLSLSWRLPEAPAVDLGRDLHGLSFVLLTHAHKDHLDLDLISALRHLPIRWVIPEFMIPDIQEQTGLPAGQIIVPSPLQPFELDGLRITSFNGQHLITYPNGDLKGVQEIGYLVESGSKRWLFPGDTRIFDTRRLPSFGPIDTLFAHLWLGHGAALQESFEMLDSFCQFCAALQPGQVVLTHLEELSRTAKDYWDASHIDRVQSRFRQDFPQLTTFPAYMGENVKI